MEFAEGAPGLCGAQHLDSNFIEASLSGVAWCGAQNLVSKLIGAHLIGAGCGYALCFVIPNKSRTTSVMDASSPLFASAYANATESLTSDISMCGHHSVIHLAKRSAGLLNFWNVRQPTNRGNDPCAWFADFQFVCQFAHEWFI